MMKLKTTPRFGLFLLAACLMLVCVYAQAVVDHELKGLGELVGAWVDGVYDSFVDNVNDFADASNDAASAYLDSYYSLSSSSHTHAGCHMLALTLVPAIFAAMA